MNDEVELTVILDVGGQEPLAVPKVKRGDARSGVAAHRDLQR